MLFITSIFYRSTSQNSIRAFAKNKCERAGPPLDKNRDLRSRYPLHQQSSVPISPYKEQTNKEIANHLVVTPSRPNFIHYRTIPENLKCTQFIIIEITKGGNPTFESVSHKKSH